MLLPLDYTTITNIRRNSARSSIIQEIEVLSLSRNDGKNCVGNGLRKARIVKKTTNEKTIRERVLWLYAEGYAF